jgi:hypothetical protein
MMSKRKEELAIQIFQNGLEMQFTAVLVFISGMIAKRILILTCSLKNKNY